VSALDFSRYTPRTYVVSEGDSLSAQKAVALEGLKAASASAKSPEKGGYQILTIPRARRVHQNILTVPFTTLRSLLASVYHVTLAPRLSGESAFDVLLLNGPGTCVVLCLATYVDRVSLWFLAQHPSSLLLIPSSWDSLPRDSFISKHLRASESSR
jgi:beta-1,4-N-acetylglucosaminyltransferase